MKYSKKKLKDEKNENEKKKRINKDNTKMRVWCGMNRKTKQ